MLIKTIYQSGDRIKNQSCLHTVNPLLSPQGAHLFQAHLRGGGGGEGLNRDGGHIWERGSFNSEKTMVSVSHKELEYTVEKFKYKKF